MNLTTELNLPGFDYKIKQIDGEKSIFDSVRGKYVKLTPEEWVRQHVIHYLLGHKGIPLGLTAVEKQVTYNQLKQRADIVVFDKTAKPSLIVECKAPSVQITQETFEQIARYNVPLRVDYFMVSNGIDHFYCKMDYENWSYQFLPDLPEYEQW